MKKFMLNGDNMEDENTHEWMEKLMSEKKRKKMTAKGLLKRYANGERNFANIIIRGGDLRDKNLEDADFRESFFADVDFEGAHLEYTDFRNAFIIRSDFSRVYFRHANLSHASFINSSLSNADLSDAKLEGTYILDTDTSNIRGLETAEGHFDLARTRPNRIWSKQNMHKTVKNK